MEITYRKLGPADAAQYRAIRLESIRAHPESFGSGYEAQAKLPKLMFEQALERPYDQRFLIGAFDQDELIGICGFVPKALTNTDLAHTGTIIQMYVRAAYSGRKVGFNLMTAVIAEAFKLGDIEQLVLGVRIGNLSAITVYEQVGFVTDEDAVGLDEGFQQMVLFKEQNYEDYH